MNIRWVLLLCVLTVLFGCSQRRNIEIEELDYEAIFAEDHYEKEVLENQLSNMVFFQTLESLNDPFLNAMLESDFPTLENLLRDGYDPNAEIPLDEDLSQNIITPLGISAVLGSIDLLELLILHGADMDNATYSSLVLTAVTWNNHPYVSFLLEQYGEYSLFRNSYKESLERAVKFDYVDTLSVLLATLPEFVNNDSDIEFLYYLTILQSITLHNVEAFHLSFFHFTAYLEGVSSDERGTPYTYDYDWRDILESICVYGNLEIFEIFHQYFEENSLTNHEFNFRDAIDTYYPIEAAVRNGRYNLLSRLVEIGGSPYVVLDYAIDAYDYGLVKYMLDSDVDPNLYVGRDNELVPSNFYVSFACRFDRLDLVKLLVAYGANLGTRKFVEGNNPGANCLHIAVSNNSPEMLRFLIEWGASGFEEEDPAGRRPIDIALEGNYEECISILEPYSKPGRPSLLRSLFRRIQNVFL